MTRVAPDSRRWELVADLSAIGPLVQAVAEFLEQHGVSGGPHLTAQLVVEELGSNIARHAYAGQAAGLLRLELRLSANQIELQLEDEGPPFDPLRQAPTPDLEAPVEQRPVGGLGLFLVRERVHSLSYRRAGNRNQVTASIGLAPNDREERTP